MKPKPFSPLNHLTVPCAMYCCSSQVDLRTVLRPAGHDGGPGALVTPDPNHRLVPAGVQNTSTETDDLPPTTPRGREMFRSREKIFRSPQALVLEPLELAHRPFERLRVDHLAADV